MHNLIQHHRENLYGLSTALHLRFITNHEYQESLEELQIFFEKRVDKALYPDEE